MLAAFFPSSKHNIKTKQDENKTTKYNKMKNMNTHTHMGTSSFKLRAIPQKYGKIMKFMIIGAAVEFPGAVFPMPMDF